MAYGRDDELGTDPAASNGAAPPSGNWWEGPPPAGYTGQWPPPLAPGASYGPNFGQVVMPPGSQSTLFDPGTVVKPGVDLPLATPPAGSGTTTTTPPPTTNTAPTGTGTLTGLLSPFTGTFQPPTPASYPGAPGFTAPGYTPPPAFEPDRFDAPTYADVQNDPGYQFASDEGRRALEQGAAKNGLLNSGGTLKDILAWGGNYAAQRYGDVYKRKQDTYGLNEGAKERAYAANYSSQFLDPYKFAYQGALDTFAPKQSQWQTNMAATQRGNENDYANAYNLFNFDYNKFRDQRDSTFNKTFQYVTA